MNIVRYSIHCGRKSTTGKNNKLDWRRISSCVYGTISIHRTKCNHNVHGHTIKKAFVRTLFLDLVSYSWLIPKPPFKIMQALENQTLKSPTTQKEAN